MNRSATFLLASVFILHGCSTELWCDTVFSDSFENRAFQEKLDQNQIRYKKVTPKQTSYLCSDIERVDAAKNELDAFFNPSCAFHVYSETKEKAFLSALSEANIDFWLVPTDEGQRVNCNAKDRDKASAVFHHVVLEEK